MGKWGTVPACQRWRLMDCRNLCMCLYLLTESLGCTVSVMYSSCSFSHHFNYTKCICQVYSLWSLYFEVIYWNSIIFQSLQCICDWIRIENTLKYPLALNYLTPFITFSWGTPCKLSRNPRLLGNPSGWMLVFSCELIRQMRYLWFVTIT